MEAASTEALTESTVFSVAMRGRTISPTDNGNDDGCDSFESIRLLNWIHCFEIYYILLSASVRPF